MRGFERFASLSSTGKINNFYSYTYYPGTYFYIGYTDIIVQRYDGSASTYYKIPSTGANQTLSGYGTNNGDTTYCTTFLGKVIMSYSDASCYPSALSTSQTTFTALSTVSNSFRYPCVHYNRLFGAYSALGGGSLVLWSDVDTVNTWPTNNTLQVNTDDGDRITGIVSYKGDLYVFKLKSVYKIVGNNFDPTSGNYSVIKLEGIPGAINFRGICVANGNMYWVSQQYIVEFNGSSFEFIDYPYLTDDRATLSYTTATTEPFLLEHNEKEHEIVFAKNATSVSWRFDYLQRQWSKSDITATTMNICSMGQYKYDGNGTKDFMFGSDSGATFLFGDYRHFVNSANTATAINTYYETDWMNCDDWRRKAATRIILETKQDGYLSAHPYALSCSVYYDYDTVARSTQVVTCEGATNQFHEIWPGDQINFRRIKLRFANNTLDNSIQVNRAIVEYDLIDESGRI
jgi:hypothetical protein